jgi:hypothetical protein
LSRSSTHRLKCTQCPAVVELTMTGLKFCDAAQRYVDAIATKEGWTLEPMRCPQHVHGEKT